MSKMEILKNYGGAGIRHGGARRITLSWVRTTSRRILTKGCFFWHLLSSSCEKRSNYPWIKNIFWDCI